VISINGVLYKSSSKKLEKSTPGKILVIRGEKFTMDSSGTKLLREDVSQSSLKLSRIDIGGVTYKQSKSGTYERDNSHNVRSHLR
jgi:hypothetical protein